MKCEEVQFRTRSRVIQTRGGLALTIAFRIGPMAVFIIANIPEDLDPKSNKAGALAYIKLGLHLDNDWEESEPGDS